MTSSKSGLSPSTRAARRGATGSPVLGPGLVKVAQRGPDGMCPRRAPPAGESPFQRQFSSHPPSCPNTKRAYVSIRGIGFSVVPAASREKQQGDSITVESLPLKMGDAFSDATCLFGLPSYRVCSGRSLTPLDLPELPFIL